jgi:hypothetical protein
MNGARMRLVIAAALFAAWLGWLAYLAATTTRPVVLSRPQFLVSTLDVVADVRAADAEPAADVIVRKVHWPLQDRQGLVDKEIHVVNLADCIGWAGPGSYILPLVRDGDAYRVAAIPPSPGYNALNDQAAVRVYPATEEALHQLDEIRKPDQR